MSIENKCYAQFSIFSVFTWWLLRKTTSFWEKQNERRETFLKPHTSFALTHPPLNSIQRERRRSLTTPFRSVQPYSQAERIDGEGKGSDGIGRKKVGRWPLRQFHFSRYSRSSRFLSRFSRPGSFPRTLQSFQFLSSFRIIWFFKLNLKFNRAGRLNA